jgi:hypothetical protein
MASQQKFGATAEEFSRSLGVTKTGDRIRLLRVRCSARLNLERRAANCVGHTMLRLDLWMTSGLEEIGPAIAYIQPGDIDVL